VIYVDSAVWPARGRLWSHLVSDVSFAELHAFAEMLGAPRRGFDRDHYDVPAYLHPVAIWLGAIAVTSREIVVRLHRAGLRRPKSVRSRVPEEQGPGGEWSTRW
jgi:hypothetical protein